MSMILMEKIITFLEFIKMEEIYVEKTVTLWGGNNGEVNMELEDGRVITFNAWELFKDLPSIVEITFDEVQKEKLIMQEKYQKLAQFIVK